MPAESTAPSTSEAVERVRVSGTEGLGANLREQPGIQGALLKTLRDGAELAVVGADLQVGDQSWRNVRDAEGTVGWVVAEALERIAPTPTPSPADAATPCRVGQLKGDATSGLFYPTGHPDYASKKDRVRCFDAESQARASGFQPAP